MNERKIGRRTFLQGTSLAALSAAGLFDARASQAQVAVPNSTGTELPKLKAPALACDCHHHIYDTARFPAPEPGAEPNARVAEYRLLQRRIGTTRDVVVTPRPYATDNRVTLDAIAQLGANARGVAVIHPDRHGRRIEDAGPRRHSRHPFFPGRHPVSARGYHDRYDRAAVETRERARLARPDQHGRRPDRRGRGFVDAPPFASWCSITWGTCRSRWA